MKYITLTLITLTLASCAHTRHTVFDPTTGNRISRTVLGGDYGIATTGDDHGGGRVYASNDTATRITISAKGDVSIDGPIDHSTRAAIQADAAVKITSNVAKLVGWLKMLDTLGDILKPSDGSGGDDSAPAKPTKPDNGGDGGAKPTKPTKPTKPIKPDGGGVGNGGKPHPVDPNKGPGKGNQRKG